MGDERERYVRFVIRTRFMPADWVDSSRLRLTYEGAYSLTPAAAAAHMVAIVERELRRPLRTCRVLECFAGHGGDTIPIIHYGEPRAVLCLEANPEHRANLRHNLRLYFPDACQRRRITVSDDGDAIAFVRWLRDESRSARALPHDVIYMDPPWGGTSYRAEQKISDIRLRDRAGQPVQLTEFVRLCRDLCSLVAIKLPVNFDAARVWPDAVVEDFLPAHIRYVLVPGVRPRGPRNT